MSNAPINTMCNKKLHFDKHFISRINFTTKFKKIGVILVLLSVLAQIYWLTKCTSYPASANECSHVILDS